MTLTTIVPGTGTDEFIECASRPGVKAAGRLFKKQILKWGSFIHPNDPSTRITVDKAFAEKLITNFANGVCDIVQVPIVNDKNQHTEDPLRNLGRVVDVDYDDKGVNAYIDAQKYADDLGKTLIGASAMMHLDYTDTSTGEKVGPTLLHVAATNRPYITELDPFSEVIAASADTSDEAVLLTAAEDSEGKDDMPKTKEELIAELKAQHGIDVEALQAAATTTTELSNVLGGGDVSVQDVAEAVLELSATVKERDELITELSRRNDELLDAQAADEVDKLIKEGKVLPAQRDVMIKLSRNDRETFNALIPDKAIVSLSEDGVTTHSKSNEDGVKAEIERIAEQYLAGKKSE